MTKDSGTLVVEVVVAASVGLVVEVVVFVVCVFDKFKGFKSAYMLRHNTYFMIYIEIKFYTNKDYSTLNQCLNII